MSGSTEWNPTGRNGVWRRMRRTILAVTTLAWLTAAAPALADCDPAGPIEQELPDAPVAFVGVVTEVAVGSARFAVEEIWAGAVGNAVEVLGLGAVPGRGGPADGVGLLEDDRVWEVGETYLVLPVVHEGALVDHQCTATTTWRDELAHLRPADARIVGTAGLSESAEFPVTPILIAVVVVAVGVASTIAFRRR